MKLSKILIAAFAVITFAAAGNTANAQTTINTTATVLQPITVSGTDLVFGDIFPGIETTVALTDAARFDITGENAATVNVDFTTFPEALSDGDGNSFPIVFNAGHHTSADAGSATSFDGGSQLSTSLSAPAEGNGELYIWLGGTVSPAYDQAPGDYSAQVVMEVAYPEN